jgi:hypothetical protein
MGEVENSEDTLYFPGAYNIYMLYVLVYRPCAGLLPYQNITYKLCYFDMVHCA